MFKNKNLSFSLNWRVRFTRLFVINRLVSVRFAGKSCKSHWSYCRITCNKPLGHVALYDCRPKTVTWLRTSDIREYTYNARYVYVMRDVTDRKGRLQLPLTKNTYIEVREWEVIFLILYFLFTFFVKVAHVNYEQHTHVKSSLIRLSVYRMDAHSVIVRNRISICFFFLLYFVLYIVDLFVLPFFLSIQNHRDARTPLRNCHVKLLLRLCRHGRL